MFRPVLLVGLALLCGCAETTRQTRDIPLPANAISLRSDPALSISGLSARSGDSIVVHDNKRDAAKPRVGIVSSNGHRPLRWTGARVPDDLEAIAAIPGTTDQFLLLTSKGHFFRAEVSGDEVRARELPRLPRSTNQSEFEGLDVRKSGERIFVIWADRGEDSTPATLSWGALDLPSGRVRDVRSREVTTPSLGSHTRHISDLRVRPLGDVIASSATDPGDDGPFVSAIRRIGRFTMVGGDIDFQPTAAQPSLRKIDRHKVEAIDFRGSEMVIGTDDEASGGVIFLPEGG
jgi:hypothetical protein